MSNFQLTNDILLDHSLCLENEHYNILANGTDYDCYFHSLAILLGLSTVEFKNSLLDYVFNSENLVTISSLIINHPSGGMSVDTLITRLSNSENTYGVYCDFYNALVLKVHLFDVHTHFISGGHYYKTRTSNSQTPLPWGPNRVINLLLVSFSGESCFFPLRSI